MNENETVLERVERLSRELDEAIEELAEEEAERVYWEDLAADEREPYWEEDTYNPYRDER